MKVRLRRKVHFGCDNPGIQILENLLRKLNATFTLTLPNSHHLVSVSYLQDIFDVLIDSYLDHGVGIAENFLSASLAAKLKENLISLYNGNQLVSAGTGNGIQVIHDKTVRRDKIYWLDGKHNNQFENEFFDLMDDFIAHLNRTCYTGITGYEFHYALYETGSFYKKHIDQFKSNGSRQYSMIVYLNADWQENDGGELCVYHPTERQVVSPVNRKSVFFKSSEMEHEVLPTNKPRMSVTGWLKVN